MDLFMHNLTLFSTKIFPFFGFETTASQAGETKTTIATAIEIEQRR